MTGVSVLWPPAVPSLIQHNPPSPPSPLHKCWSIVHTVLYLLLPLESVPFVYRPAPLGCTLLYILEAHCTQFVKGLGPGPCQPQLCLEGRTSGRT